MQDAPEYVLNRALFSVPTAYFKLLQTKKAQQSLKKTFEKGDKTREDYPLNTYYILQAINQLGSSFWQDQIVWIIPLYAKHKELENLSAVTCLFDCFFY